MRRLLLLALGLALAACSNSKPVKPPPPPPAITQDVVNFSTYLGNDLADSVRDIALDAAFNVYVTGSARSANLLPGAPVAAFGGNEDAFVAKFDANGALLWWTFVGGPGPDSAYAIGLDGNNDIVIGGGAAAGFPVTPGALLTQFQGGAGACDPNQLPTNTMPAPPAGSACDPDTADPARDGFVAKLAGANGALQWATYFGSGRFDVDIYQDVAGMADDNVTDFNDDTDPRTSIVRDVAVDSMTGAIYLTFSVVVPTARDPAFIDDPMVVGDRGALVGNLPPVIVAALQLGERPLRPGLNDFSGATDGILAKLASTGATLDWATFVGGVESESAVGLVEFDQGNPIVVFSTASSTRATTEDPLTKLITATEDIATHAVDAAAYNNALRVYGSSDLFISKYDSNGARLWATHVGGNGSELLDTGNLAVRIDGGVVLAVRTDSIGNFVGPPPSSAFDPQYNGSGSSGFYSADCGIFVLSPDGTLREGATYYGGGLGDACTGVAVDSNNRVYVGGGTHSADLPVRPTSPQAPFQNLRPGARSGFLAVFSPDLTTLYYGGYFGGTGLGNVKVLRLRESFPDGARLVFGGEAGAGYPLAPATPVRGTVTAPPEHGVVTDARIFF